MSVSPRNGAIGQSGLVIPENIPGADLKPWKLDDVAATLRTAGAGAVAQAATAEASWSGLPGVLESPQGAVIYAALGSPSTHAAEIERRFDRVADALEQFADAVRPIKQTFADIKSDAVAFRATITWDERVWVSPRETKEYEGNGLAVVSTTSYSTSYSTGSSLSDVLEYLKGRGESTRVRGGAVQILAHWTESSEHIDKNNALMDRLADAYTRLQNAEADCANAINRQRESCLAEVEYIEAWQLKQSGENTVVLPWGSRVDEDRNCGESFWWGMGSAGKEALEGAGGLIGYNGVTGSWSLDNAGQAWLGAAQGIGALLVIASPPLILLGMAGVPVLKDGVSMGQEMIKGLVAWDTWSQNPSEAAGRVLVNVGSMFIPGAGAVSAAIKSLSAGSRIVDLAGDAARLTGATGAGIAKVDGLLTRLDGLAGDAVGTGSKVDGHLVTVGARADMPDGDLLHVGARTPDGAPPASLLDDAAPGLRHEDAAPAPRPHSGDEGPGPVRADDDPAPPPARGDDDALPPGRGDGDSPPADHWSNHPAFNDADDPVVWRNDTYDTALTASQKADADAYLALSREVEPAITEAMSHIAARHPDASLTGLDYALKGQDSFYRKYATDIQDALARGDDVDGVLGRINDSVRYTFMADDAAYASTASAVVAGLRAAGFELVAEPKNFWAKHEGYVGINSTWRDGSGRLFEVQFHTPGSFYVKDVLTHGWYEEWRLPGTDAARKAELEQLQNDAFAEVPHPPGADDIRWPGRE